MSVNRVSAPGRVCLFGEHQDYLGLPVIAAAVSLRITIEWQPSDRTCFLLDQPDIGQTAAFKPNEPQVYDHQRDYLRSAINVLLREGMTWSRGITATMRSEIPINAGVSSSSAMVTAWLRLLGLWADQPVDLAGLRLARLAHRAEVMEFGEAGGMMDHFCAAMGGVLFIDTHPPFSAKALEASLSGLVLGNSREPKATVETLKKRRAEVLEGVRQMTAVDASFDLKTTPWEEAVDLLGNVDALPRRRVTANLVNRGLCADALDALTRGASDQIGKLLDAHHAQLRDGLDLSTPKIERMIEAAHAAGALGAKINGSGGGGCMFAYAPGREYDVADAIRRAGGDAYIVGVDDGASKDG